MWRKKDPLQGGATTTWEHWDKSATLTSDAWTLTCAVSSVRFAAKTPQWAFTNPKQDV